MRKGLRSFPNALNLGYSRIGEDWLGWQTSLLLILIGAMARDPMIDNEAPHSSGGLEGLLDTHRAELLRFLAARCGDASEAEDLFQELWLKVRAASPVMMPRKRARRSGSAAAASSRKISA